MCSADCFLAILAVLFPPIAVWVKCGICSADSVINLALCCLGFIPGLLHAWYIIARYPEAYSYNYEPLESGQNQRVYYYTATYPSVSSHTQPSYAPKSAPPQPQASAAPQGSAQYGATSSTAPLAPVTENAAVADPPKQALPSPDHLNVADGMEHGEGSSSANAAAPPSYSDVVKGDFKIQTD